MIRNSLKKVLMGESLSEEEMEHSMSEIIDGHVTPAQVGAFITALRMKGETVYEITGAARALNSRILKIRASGALLNLDRDDINIEEETILETCDIEEKGTYTFNVSTATIFVAAGGGVKVVRHGSRAVSKLFGTADVLEHLGVKLDISRSDVESCLEEVGIAFLFAPLYQGLMRHVAALRIEMGIRTIFNLIGPLANPAGAVAHMLGVYIRSHTDKMAQVFKKLGAKDALVVFGEGTIDEISVCGQSRISRLKNGEIETFDIEPETYGFKRAEIASLHGGNAGKNAEIIKAVLNGELGSRRDIVLLNAGAAFVAAGVADDLKEGIERAIESVDSGKAKAKLDALIAFSTRCTPFVRKELL